MGDDAAKPQPMDKSQRQQKPLQRDPPPPKPSPGWYPNPSGQPGQRYWDGSKWRRPISISKALLIVGGVVFALVGGCAVLAALLSNHDSQPSSSPSTAAAAPANAVVTVEPSPDGDVVRATFAISDNFTRGMAKFGAQTDTIDILKWAHRMYPNAAKVTVQGTHEMVDDYGNKSTIPVVNVTYSRETLSKINFDGVQPGDIWGLRDSGTIHPDFQP